MTEKPQTRRWITEREADFLGLGMMLMAALIAVSQGFWITATLASLGALHYALSIRRLPR